MITFLQISMLCFLILVARQNKHFFHYDKENIRVEGAERLDEYKKRICM